MWPPVVAEQGLGASAGTAGAGGMSLTFAAVVMTLSGVPRPSQIK
ncbi:hypothetical protein STVIR_8041 [Streptomyces viridochromogenes Tue57]|uniref:Uncharacterized protein n=1 Tax=Streptomyces viridochromogenes Tue57 TaxID=1160705 RepID=L8P073_STRVR|nr:hypothetical protein STVIR_8041 [Streptomyces viridochromogenes Tue57]